MRSQLSMGLRLAETAEAVFASPDVDAVLIATATPTHADYIEQAVAAGKPVLCEKPIDLSLARVDACAERIRGTNPVPISSASTVASIPAIGRPVTGGPRRARSAICIRSSITSRDPGMPPRRLSTRQSGGLFRDMTIHDFDLARFMLDEEPEDVFAIGSRLIDAAD